MMSPCFVLSVKLDHGADGVVVGIEESLGIFVGNNVGGDAFRVGEDVVNTRVAVSAPVKSAAAILSAVGYSAISKGILEHSDLGCFGISVEVSGKNELFTSCGKILRVEHVAVNSRLGSNVIKMSVGKDKGLCKLLGYQSRELRDSGARALIGEARTGNHRSR